MENLDRLKQLRDEMRKAHIDILLVRSTDQWLNEYVPLEQSRRAYITGFTGSIGDAMVTQNTAILFVDGRYALQAKQECPSWDVRVLALGKSISSGWLDEVTQLMSSQKCNFAVEYDRIPIALMDQIPNSVSAEAVWKNFGPSATSQNSLFWSVSTELTGQSTPQRLEHAKAFFKEHKLDAILVTPLDEIAWLLNWRSDEFPYQAIFSARAMVFPNEIWVAMTPDHLKQTLPSEAIRWMSENDWNESTQKRFKEKTCRISLDRHSTSESIRRHFESVGAEIVLQASPFTHAKAIKNPQELAHMRSAFVRADHTVYRTQQWACEQIAQGETITEQSVDEKVRKEFTASGAKGLSFKPICGAGKNGAIIHYGNPDGKTPLKQGELFLLDTGGLYEGGYATDLTRTFLLGDANTQAQPFQKRLFTLVLKAAIAGMSARFPKGTTGTQLDAIVRDPIWRAGKNFEHGTGHGVGINVHESPPRISSAGDSPLLVGHVFSIEPGLYEAGVGGVRIENLCTVITDPQNDKFLCVLPLTFAPLDKRLFDTEMLTGQEKQFLQYYESCFELDEGSFPPLPPYPI